MDGKKLDSRYYTVSGSDVTLTADYLKTLRSGKHTVKIENAAKVATGSFTLSGSGAVQSSRTGDPGVAIYFAMGAVSFLGSAAWLRKRKGNLITILLSLHHLYMAAAEAHRASAAVVNIMFDPRCP